MQFVTCSTRRIWDTFSRSVDLFQIWAIAYYSLLLSFFSWHNINRQHLSSIFTFRILCVLSFSLLLRTLLLDCVPCFCCQRHFATLRYYEASFYLFFLELVVAECQAVNHARLLRHKRLKRKRHREQYLTCLTKDKDSLATKNQKFLILLWQKKNNDSLSPARYYVRAAATD